MPIENLHLTALEITHSLPRASDIKGILDNLGPAIIEQMTDYPFTYRSRLIRPMVSYDGAAIALSFLPAAGEGLPASTSTSLTRTKADDDFTYHHLRRDLFNIASSTGVKIESRYVVPSSHITIGRFLSQKDHDEKKKMERWIEGIESINEWLERNFWPKDGKKGESQGEWIVGQEKGLDCRWGTLWYGGGETVRLGRGS